MSSAQPPLHTLLLVAAALLGGSSTAHASNLCTPPNDSVPKWHAKQAVPGITVRIPPGLSLVRSGASFQRYQGGRRSFGVSIGEGAGDLARLSELSQIDFCQAVIQDRPVQITTYTYVQEDAAMNPTGQAGSWYVAIARWPAVAGQPTVTLWMESNLKSDLMTLRPYFFTVQLPALTAAKGASSPSSATPGSGTSPTLPAQPGSRTDSAACLAPTSVPLPAIDAIVDTALVQMLAASDSAPAPGFAVLALHYDDQGGVASVDVTDTDLAPSEQRHLAALVSSNIRSRAANTPQGVQIHVSRSAHGLEYRVMSPGCGNGG